MENKKFLSQANELGPNCGKAIRTETERRNLGVYLTEEDGWKICKLILVIFALSILSWGLGLT
jgi:hypothetical protein